MGHDATSCRLITRALRDYGHRVIVATWVGLSASLREEFDAQAVFRINTYTFGRGDGDPICAWLAPYFFEANSTANDLKSLGPFTADDLLYVNSVLPAQLRAVCIFLQELPEAGRPQIVVELGTERGVEFATGDGPGFRVRDPRTDPRATLYHFTGRLLKELSLPQLHLASFDRISSGVYAQLLQNQVATLPLPHLAARASRRRGGSGPRIISFLGDQREDKGYHLVPEIALLLLASCGDVRLLIHNARPGRMGNTQQVLRDIAEADPRVELDERAAGPEIWHELLERSDVIVCPYVTDRYRAAYSAVAAEAVAWAIPLVTPAQTTLDSLVPDFNAGGVSFDRLTPAKVVAAVQRVLADFDTHAARALAAAGRWGETMGANRMVETMLARLAAEAMLAREPDTIAA